MSLESNLTDLNTASTSLLTAINAQKALLGQVASSADLAAPTGVDLVGGAVSKNKAAILKYGVLPYTSSQVNAFGDSITRGVGASVPANAYAQLLNSQIGGTLSNQAISGGSIMDWIQNTYTTSVADDGIAFILPGFNDARVIGTNALQQTAYQLALYAAVAYLAIPESKKIKGNSAAITYAGAWTATPIRSYGKYTSTLNDTASFSVSGDTVYISSVQQLGTGGLLNVVVDGVDRGTFSLMRSVANGGAVSSVNYMPMLIRIPGLGDGVHVVVCKNAGKEPASSSTSTYIDWVAGSSSRSKTNARVYVGNTLTMLGYANDANTGTGYNKASDAVMATFSRLSEQVCADLATDGLDVAYVDASGSYNPTTEASTDGVHPGDAGHLSIASAFLSALQLLQRPAITGLLSQVRKNRKDTAVLLAGYVPTVSGTWLPTLGGYSTPGSNTYSTQIGNYKVINGLCTASFEISISTFGASMVGALVVSLPVPAAALGTYVGSLGVRSGITLTAGCSGLYLESIAGSLQMVLRQSAPAETELTPSNLAVGMRLRGTITYAV